MQTLITLKKPIMITGTCHTKKIPILVMKTSHCTIRGLSKWWLLIISRVLYNDMNVKVDVFFVKFEYHMGSNLHTSCHLYRKLGDNFVF